MKLLLTSSGLDNPKLKEEFLRLVGKPASEIKVLFIPTASRTKEELCYLMDSWKELLGLGILEQNIIKYNLEGEVDKDIDVMYVCGGNTFYLLHKFRESGFDKKFKEFIERGVICVGVSAGSMIMGPDIDVCGIRSYWDQNDVGLKDLTGLNITDKRISPHYVDDDEVAIIKYEKKGNKKVLRLRDGSALRISEDGEEVLGKIIN